MQVGDVLFSVLLSQLVVLLRHCSEVDVLGMWTNGYDAVSRVFRSPGSQLQCFGG